jgi:hypothetical protein
MPPLPLDSPRWKQLKAHFGDAGDAPDLPAVPNLLVRWGDAIGRYAEEYAYHPLRESFLHQGTILDVAYAVVPHLAARLGDLPPDRRLDVLADIADVEAVRRVPRAEVERRVAALQTMSEGLRGLFTQTTRDRHPELPDDLAGAWFEALAVAQASAAALLGEVREASEFRLVLETLCGLHGQPELAGVLATSTTPRRWARSPGSARRSARPRRAAGGVTSRTCGSSGGPTPTWRSASPSSPARTKTASR